MNVNEQPSRQHIDEASPSYLFILLKTKLQTLHCHTYYDLRSNEKLIHSTTH